MEIDILIKYIVELGPPYFGWLLAVYFGWLHSKSEARCVEIARENTETILAFADKSEDRRVAFEQLADSVKKFMIIVDERTRQQTK